MNKTWIKRGASGGLHVTVVREFERNQKVPAVSLNKNIYPHG